jgi:hypothetical protein
MGVSVGYKRGADPVLKMKGAHGDEDVAIGGRY